VSSAQPSRTTPKPRPTKNARGRNGAVPAAEGSRTRSADLRGEDPQQLLGYFRTMALIRRLEEKAAEMYQRARIGGYCHLNLGEEATCVGLAAGMQSVDYLFTNYREHGYAIARGSDPGRVMAELFGREDGLSRGRGGSMHLFDAERRLMGGYAIVGGQLPLATGAALAVVRQGRDEVVVCQMGDATTNIGAFHESLNLASLWKLPVVFFIANNGYGMGTPVDKGSALAELHQKACAYGMPGERVDGADVLAVRDATRRAVERARQDRTPSLLDVISVRLKGHSVVDPDRYRSEEYLREIRSQDPLLLFGARLKAAGVADDADLERLEQEVEEEVQAAAEFAEDSPEPDPAKLFEFSYATPVPNQPAALPGQQPWR
jgi:pyruvate dehydrogenase E1 component alpha subunit